MKVEIIRNFDYRHAPAVIQAFRIGQTPNLPKKIAEALIAAKAAEPLELSKGTAADAADTTTADKE